MCVEDPFSQIQSHNSTVCCVFFLAKMKLWAQLTLLAFLSRVSVQQCTIGDFKGVAINMINTKTSNNISINRIYYNCLSRSDTNDLYSSMSVSILFVITNSNGRIMRSEVRYNLQCSNSVWEIVGNQSTALRSNTGYDCSDCTDQTVNDYHCTSKLVELFIL